MAEPSTPHTVASITNADRCCSSRLLLSLFLLSSLLILPDDDTNPIANAAAVDRPPMAALEAVSTSSQLDDGKFSVRACSACRSCCGSIIPRYYVDDEDAAMPPHLSLLANSLPRLPKLIPPYVTNNVTTECTPNASNANSNADGPPIMADDKLAVVPTEAKSRWKQVSDNMGAIRGICCNE